MMLSHSAHTSFMLCSPLSYRLDGSPLTVPVFGRGTKCFRAKYHVVGLILHSGPSPIEGCYSAILRTKLDCDRGSCWMVQTGRQAVHTAVLPSCASQSCYLLMLIRSRILQQGTAE